MKRIVQNLVLVAAAIIASVLIAEGMLRLAGYSSPRFLRVDPDLGVAHLEGAEGWYSNEGGAYVRINSDGLRDVEHKIAKPDDTIRIAILGDSYAEGLQVDLSGLFWKTLETRLASCPRFEGREIEAINFGVSGYGTAHQLLMLRNKVWKYSPDIIILAFLTGNDVRNNSKELNNVDYMPYFDLNETGGLVLDTSFRSSPGYTSRTGALAQIFYAHGNKWRILQLVRDVRAKWSQRGADTADEAGLDSEIYLPPQSPAWRSAWSVTEALIGEIAREVNAGGARFLLVTLSNAVQVDPDIRVREEFASRHGITDLFYPDNRIRSAGERLGIEVLSLAPELARLAESDGQYLHGFDNSGLGRGHWNAAGHDVAGTLIARYLCQSND